MNFSNFDLFSQQFYFNIKSAQIRKGTLFGSLLSIAIFGLTSCYFVYILNQYINNLIAPNYKSQFQTNDGSINLELSEDLITFRFESDYNVSVDLLEQQTNQKYIVYMAYLLYLQQENYQIIPLDVIKCSNPELQGYYCLDFQKIQNYTLISNQKNHIQSQVQINVYGCQDLDYFKTTIPDNCASQEKIDNLINGVFSSLKIRIETSQYNTTSQKIEKSYRSTAIYGLSSASMLTTLKILEQITSVKQGLVVQQQTSFFSPVQYSIENQSLDKKSTLQLTGIQQFFQINILIDEIFQYVEIQYPSLPQIISFVYGVFSMLMLVGFVARKASLSTIKKDFIMLFLQNYYQDLYLQISKDANLVQQNNEQTKLPQQPFLPQHQCSQNQSDEEDLQDIEDNQIQNKIENQLERFQTRVPSFPFQYQHILDQKGSSKKKDSLKTEDQSICASDQQSIYNSQFFSPQLKQQKLLQQNDVNESAYDYCKESLENSHNYSNFKIINSSPTKIKKQKTKSLYLTINQLPNLKLHESSPAKQMQAQANHSQFFNTPLKENKKNPGVPNTSNTSNTQKIFNGLSKEIDKAKEYKKSIQKLEVSKNPSISKKIYSSIFGFKCWKFKKFTNNFDKSKLKKIESQIERELDIFRIYKDILFLKKAIYILLSHEQLAALQLMGCNSYFLDLQQSQFQELSNKQENKLNYYEQQLAISLSDELQCQFSQKFLEKCQSRKSDLHQIDQRILQSIQNDFIG